MLGAKVSVIVPIFNSEAYLPMCIESILNQTYRNIEILLIDDGSKDNSLKICNEYACRDNRIKVLHQENRGVSVARNIGIEVAQGEFITFVDSDDELLENGIFLLVNDIESFGADVSIASKLYITSDQKVLNRRLGEGREVCVFVGTEALQLSLDFDRRMTACHGKLFRKQFISDIRYVEGKRINEDFYFVFLCCIKQPIITYRDECVYKYYYRENSASHATFGDKYFDMLYFADQKKRMIEEYYPELLDKAICMEVSTHLFLLNMLCETKEKKYKKEERKSIEFVKNNHKIYTTFNKFEKKLAWIVAHGLYPIYKMAVRLKYYR